MGRTEWSWVHEAPEGVVGRLETVSSVSGTWNDLLHEDAKDVGENLEEELGHRDGLRAEVEDLAEYGAEATESFIESRYGADKVIMKGTNRDQGTTFGT